MRAATWQRRRLRRWLPRTSQFDRQQHFRAHTFCRMVTCGLVPDYAFATHAVGTRLELDRGGAAAPVRSIIGRLAKHLQLAGC